MEDSNFSQPDDESKFIVLPSQEETQPSFQSDSKMREYLVNLPALQNPDAKKKRNKLDLGTPSDQVTEKKKDKVLVPDSEYDSERHTEHTEPSDYVSESEDESHSQNADTSEDKGDVTVIRKTLADKEQATEGDDKDKAESSHPSSESSFQSKNRSNLGSYDQCELYRTQKDHAKGYRFSLFGSSQDDMFAPGTDADPAADRPVSTPAEHLGSLSLSQKPMLVPETIEETGNAISPSPEVYGSTPIIIPNSPTQQSQDMNEASMFDVNAANTLAESSKGFEFGDSSEKENSVTSKGSKTPEPEVGSLSKSPIDIDAALQMDTLVEDDKISSKAKRSKTLRAKNAEQKQQKISESREQTLQEQKRMSPIIVSQDTAEDLQAVQESDDEVILIPTGTEETQQEEQSEQLFLHLSPSQTETTQGQKSQSRLSMSCLQDRESQPQAATKPALEEPTTSKQVEVVEIESQQSQDSPQKYKQSSPDCVEIIEDEGQCQKKPSQRETSQGQRSNKSTSSWGSGSQKSDRSQKSERSQKRREEKMLADVNDNPQVIWKDESDTDQFHLTLPKDGDLLHPTDVTTGKHSQGQPADLQEAQSEAKISQDKNLEKESKKDNNQESVMSEDSHREEQLTIGAIQSESEPVTQPTFRLERPAMPDVELSQEAPEVLFTRSSPRQNRANARVILEDEDSDDEVTFKDKLHIGAGDGPVQDSKSEKAGPSMEVDEDIYIAQRLGVVVELNKSVDETQSYDPVQEISNVKTDTSTNVNTAETDKSIEGNANLQTTESKDGEANKDNVTKPLTKAALVQSCTQTQETSSQTPMDINVVQKVTEYLQSGYSPRSRSSSSNTEISDLQGSEKSEGTMKTPKRINRERRMSSASLRRESTEKRSPKSPKDIQDILNTYSNLLNKGKKFSQSGSQLLQREISITESVEDNKDRDVGGETMSQHTPMRRGSVTNLSSGRQTPVRRDSHTDTTINRKDSSVLLSPSQQSLVRKDSNASDNSDIRKENGNTSVVKQDSNTWLSKSVNKDNIDNSLVLTRTDGIADNIKATEDKATVPSKGNIQARKDLVQQYGGAENGNIHTTTRPVPTNVQQEAELFTETNVTPRTPQVPDAEVDNRTPRSTKGKHSSKKKVKRLFTSSKRSERRKSVDSASPRLPSGSFVSSTQRFSTEKTGAMTSSSSPARLHRGNTFDFHGTQSQITPEEVISASLDSVRTTQTTSTSHIERTPLSSRKRSRLQHKKSGLKKSRIDENSAHTTPSKHHVSFKNTNDESHDRQVSQRSDVTTATIGSLPSMPSSISSPGCDFIMSPSGTSSGSRQSVAEEVSARLSGKRMSIEPALPDTIPLQQGEEENYQRVTVETQTVKRVYTEITTTKKIIGPQGQILESSVDVKKSDPTVMEESTHKRMQYMFISSPSRSAASLTSGDLADISSSLSRSSVSSSSLGSKGNTINRTASSSLEARSLEKHTSLNQTGNESKDERSNDKDTNEQRKDRSTQEISGHKTPITSKDVQQKDSRKSAPSTPALPEVSVVLTPLGSTINKTGSYLHSRTTSMESPKHSSSLFTSPEETKASENKESAASKSSENKIKAQPDRETKRQISSSDDISAEIPNQDQAVSSSSPSDNSLVPSSGVVGCRVIAKWKDGFFYPGTLKSSSDRFSRCSVRFDDGDSMNVKVTEILLIEQLPVGQSVMVLTEEGDFECGLISRQHDQHYTVSKDSGDAGRYPHSQVILSSDQAACIMADAGSEILLQHAGLPVSTVTTGEVSLDNLIDQPRRSAKKKQVLEVGRVEDQEQPSTSKSRKRKIDELKPKATSTPTPKGKAEIGAKRRKVMDVDESPIETSQSSPLTARRSPRKARDRLFQKDIGPLPTKKLFRGLTFLLTNVEKSQEQREFEEKLLQDSSLEVSTDESAVEDEISAPFNKDHLKAQIEAGGGVCLENFDDKLVGKKKCYLLSSTYQRTIKYLQCLASGIPCVSHMWLVDSCSQGHLLDENSYLLPNGVSLEKRKIMEWYGSVCRHRGLLHYFIPKVPDKRN